MLFLNLKAGNQLSRAHEQSSVFAISRCPESADQDSRPSAADFKIKTAIPFYSPCSSPSKGPGPCPTDVPKDLQHLGDLGGDSLTLLTVFSSELARP